ncbi:MAG: hypothetical protein ISS33_02520 [Candidatus Omnitrophica bacterium]|nr:hypothetical protein [Candidatus Omnitrophota bacterium]
MQASIFIARIFGLCYLVIGIGFLFNRKAFERVMEDFCRNAALVFYGGLLALISGIAIVLVHNVWVCSWVVMITLIGWIAIIKGIWIIVFPDSIARFMRVYEKNKNILVFHASAALIFGAVLTFFGFFAIM